MPRDIYERMRDGDADPGMYPDVAEAVGMHGGPSCHHESREDAERRQAYEEWLEEEAQNRTSASQEMKENRT